LARAIAFAQNAKRTDDRKQIPERRRAFAPSTNTGTNMATIELTKENFNQTIEGSDMVIVDFWAPWCGPCRMFAPTFEATSEKYPNVVFAKLNTEDQQELAASFNIRSIPTLMVFREKVIIFSQAGMLPKAQFELVVDKSLELDMAKVHAEIAAQVPQSA
jgi:thioredoxin 1